MLKREGDHIFDSLGRIGRRVSREAFTDDNLDASYIIARAPMVLVEELTAERGELERLKLSLLRHFCHFSRVSLNIVKVAFL